MPQLALEEKEEAAGGLVRRGSPSPSTSAVEGGGGLGEGAERDDEGVERGEADEGQEVLDDEGARPMPAAEAGEVVEGTGEVGVGGRR